MLIPGLVSITFRELDVQSIIQLCTDVGLRSIEWGGDVHVPHGDVQTAIEVGKQTRDAGLLVSAYGSYYRYDDIADEPKDDSPSFDQVLKSAVALQAPVIRVWAGRIGFDQSSPEWIERVVTKTREMAEQAADQNIKLAFEFHGNTLTDSNDGTFKLLSSIDHDNVYTFWQPPIGMASDRALQGLGQLLPRVLNLHCFHWGPGGWKDRRPLAEGQSTWEKYLALADLPGTDRHVSFEYVRDDSISSLEEDAVTLLHLTAEHQFQQ